MRVIVLIEKWSVPKKPNKFVSLYKTATEQRKMKKVFKKKLPLTDGDLPIKIKDFPYTVYVESTSIDDDKATIGIKNENVDTKCNVEKGVKTAIVSLDHYYFTFKLCK